MGSRKKVPGTSTGRERGRGDGGTSGAPSDRGGAAKKNTAAGKKTGGTGKSGGGQKK